MSDITCVLWNRTGKALVRLDFPDPGTPYHNIEVNLNGARRHFGVTDSEYFQTAYSLGRRLFHFVADE